MIVRMMSGGNWERVNALSSINSRCHGASSRDVIVIRQWVWDSILRTVSLNNWDCALKSCLKRVVDKWPLGAKLCHDYAMYYPNRSIIQQIVLHSYIYRWLVQENNEWNSNACSFNSNICYNAAQSLACTTMRICLRLFPCSTNRDEISVLSFSQFAVSHHCTVTLISVVGHFGSLPVRRSLNSSVLTNGSTCSIKYGRPEKLFCFFSSDSILSSQSISLAWN